MTFDPEKIRHFPTKPGVYIMKGEGGKVLYVGKAKSIRQRVRQYFLPGGDGREMIPHLIARVETIETIVVTSEKEALLLENTLIKQHQPKYNACLKDDRSYFSLALNHKDKWPLVRVVRFKGKPPKNHLYFGPYTRGYAARQTLELIRHLFPLRQCSDRELASRTRPCILYELKRCIAPCVGKCTKDEYDHLVKRVIQFLRGHDSGVLKELKAERERAAEQLDFERADHLHQTITYIESTIEKQKVDQAGTGDYDVIGLFRQADHVILTQLFFREGKLTGTHHHPFTHNVQESADLVTSFLLQHYVGREPAPEHILLPLDVPSSLSDLLNIPLSTPKRGDKRALVKMAEENALAYFEQARDKRDQKEQVLVKMEELFHLTNYPERIECFDNSHISGTDPVSALVVYVDGEKASKHYRKYKIKTADPSDDYGALREALTRRFSRAVKEDNLPDLLVIDGGKGHLGVALEVLSSLDVSTVDVIGVAKEAHKHTKGVTQEQVFLPGETHPLLLPPHSPVLFFLQQVRDEAHRFALTFHKARRTKRTLSSALDSLPGIGPTKKNRLLRHFGSLKRILAATPEELLAIKGITQKDVKTLKSLSDL